MARMQWLVLLIAVVQGVINLSCDVDRFLGVVNVDMDYPCARNITQQEAYTHRNLVASNLDLFRSAVGYGFRGQSNALIVPHTNVDECAAICVEDQKCLSFDSEANTCFISHTDRYAHPSDFLPRSASVYYEWDGAGAAPTIIPNGGNYFTHVSVRLFTTTRAASIYYKIIATNGTIVSDFTLLNSSDSIILPEFPCVIHAYSWKIGLEKSTTTISSIYNIQASKYMYLVPFYNGDDFHGKLIRVKLDVYGMKRPRPSLVLEFTDLDTFFGIGPFPEQLKVLNLSAIDARLSGFYDGFSVVSTTSYVNVSLEVWNDLSQWSLVDKTVYRVNPGNMIYKENIPVQEEILYLSPYQNANGYSGVIAKVYLRAFEAALHPPSLPSVVQTLDLTVLDSDLTGFASCFHHKSYGYFVQRRNQNGLGGKIVRIDLSKFHLGARSAASILDLEQKDPRLVGFSGAFVYGDFAYLVPLDRNRAGLETNENYRYFPTLSSSLVARINLNDFSTVETIDLSLHSPKYARGYFGGFTVNSFAYFVPHMWTGDLQSPKVNPHQGVVVRMNLATLALESLDLTRVDPTLRGFMRGYAYGKYAILVPYRNRMHDGPHRLNPSQLVHFGKIVRINTDFFTPETVDVLDLTEALRTQIPNIQDKNLRGFMGGGASGQYGFFVPYFDGIRFSGKVVRVNLRTFNEVQVLDMTQVDDTLRGFTNGIISTMNRPTDTSLWHWTIPEGTRAEYEFITEDSMN